MAACSSEWITLQVIAKGTQSILVKIIIIIIFKLESSQYEPM